MDATMLRAEAVRFAYGPREVLSGVDLELAAGELLAVVGPNGSGKSTLVNVLSGERAPASGRVLLGGRDLVQWAGADLARARAVLPQAPALAFAFSVLEVVLMGRAPHPGRGDSAGDLAIARSALEAVDLVAEADRPYTELSGGERQRVHLARVLAQVWEPPADRGAPHLLLLDEPTAGLDLAHQHAALAAARNFARRGGAALAVLHDLDHAMAYADRVAVLQAGRALATGPAPEVLTPDRVEAVFRVKAELLPPTAAAGRPRLVTSPLE